ncbi:MAG: hypothetical protein H6739_35715 [Alphaproteobacteria bacterium]|nr:hypothetical protein [Alphaproteobacteria bacterium]
MLSLLLACADPPPDAALYAEAMRPELPVDEALEACVQLREGASECAATVLRDRPDADPERCGDIPDPRWRGECHFAVSERLIAQGDRWGGLRHCGLAGPYYDECLYHAWSRELQATAEPERADVQTRAVDHLEAGRKVVRFWSGVRSVAQDPEALLWDDWWYFAHSRNKPADLAACEALAEDDRARCVRGTVRFVERYVTETVIRPGFDPRALDRACRAMGDEAPEDPLALVPSNVLAGLYVPDPRLDNAAVKGLENACTPDVARPWNPVFRPIHGGRVAPGDAAPDAPTPPEGAPPSQGAPTPAPTFQPRPP